MTLVLSLVLSVSAFAAEGKSAVQDQGGVNMEELRLLLSSFIALGEGRIKDDLLSLKLLSATREVQSGHWKKMKRILAVFGRGTDAAAVWFARPDGSYYTVEEGLTGQNLKDRPYFPKLMEGKDVTGHLVVSKSTGKRSAVVAVPVRQKGAIIGALGVSLSVSEISRAIERQMALPQNMVFYALDASGQTSLHRNEQLLFAYPSDMGSKSLSEKVGEMLSKREGVVTYDFRGKRVVVFRRAPLTGWIFAVGVIGPAPAAAAEHPQQTAVSSADGRYLLEISGCNDCHTGGYLFKEGNVPEAEWLTGDILGWSGPWGTTYAPNLRLVIPNMTEDDWVVFARALKVRPPMPWWELRNMKEADLRALYRFIKDLGPKGAPAPAFLPPGQKPEPPYALFVIPKAQTANQRQ
jgi:hypothetical protein